MNNFPQRQAIRTEAHCGKIGGKSIPLIYSEKARMDFSFLLNQAAAPWMCTRLIEYNNTSPSQFPDYPPISKRKYLRNFTVPRTSTSRADLLVCCAAYTPDTVSYKFKARSSTPIVSPLAVPGPSLMLPYQTELSTRLPSTFKVCDLCGNNEPIPQFSSVSKKQQQRKRQP